MQQENEKDGKKKKVENQKIQDHSIDGTDSETQVYESFEVNNNENIPLSYNEHFLGWLETTKFQDDEYTSYLYKMSGRHSNRNRELCGKYIDEIPEADFVGKEFGAGRYKVMVQFPNKPGVIKTYTFTLHGNYDHHTERHNNQNKIESGQNQSTDMMGIFTQVFAMVNTMMGNVLTQANNNNGNNNTSNASFEKVMSSMVTTMGGAMKQITQDQLSMVNDISRQKLKLPAESTDNEEEAGFLAQIIPVIKQFLPAVLESTGVQKISSLKLLKSLPQYKKLVSNSRLLAKLLTSLRESEGEEKVVKMLETLSIKDPNNTKENA